MVLFKVLVNNVFCITHARRLHASNRSLFYQDHNTRRHVFYITRAGSMNGNCELKVLFTPSTGSLETLETFVCAIYSVANDTLLTVTIDLKTF